MKRLKLLGLCAMLWLTGCATTVDNTPVQPADTITLVPSQTLNTPPKLQEPRNGNGPRFPSAGAGAVPQMDFIAQQKANQEADQRASSRAIASLSPPKDLWDRIRRGYAMPDLDNGLVHDREQWYATRPDYIYRMTERSKKYLFHIVEGLERRDVLASTRAALDYLQKLYNLFGDWHLALAAYNWGEGSVGKAIGKNQRANLGLGYDDLSMPMETRMYVPKLQAIKNIVAQPELFNSRLPAIGNHPYFDTVTIRRDIDVVLAAKLAEVPMEDFKALNPSVNKPVIMAAGTPQILLPWDNAKIFQTNLDGYSGGRLASWTVWVAPTAMRTADAAKKVGMAEADFRSINNIPPRMMIRPGSALLVPRAAHTEQDVTSHVADTGQVSLSPEIVLRKTIVHAARGANVSNVALKYKVTAANVAQWNNVALSASFKAKQPVILFLPQSQAGKAAAAEPADDKPGARTAKPVAKPAGKPARAPAPVKKKSKKG
ncbi:MAG: transglycosylase SLT domain-containing protein [Rhodoferax sp.]|nr:transglycosylase SLT domain-containing protein [Rhodoferax sp.]